MESLEKKNRTNTPFPKGGRLPHQIYLEGNKSSPKKWSSDQKKKSGHAAEGELRMTQRKNCTLTWGFRSGWTVHDGRAGGQSPLRGVTTKKSCIPRTETKLRVEPEGHPKLLELLPTKTNSGEVLIVGCGGWTRPTAVRGKGKPYKSVVGAVWAS